MASDKSPLARVELIASSQDYKDNAQGLAVNVWFPPQEEVFSIDGKDIVMRFGFVEADLQISDTRDCTYHKIRNVILAEEKFTSSHQSTGEKKNELGGGAKATIPFVSAKAEASSQNATSTSESREISSTRSLYIAEAVDKARWKLSGCAHDDGLLHGSIIHSDGGLLCTLKWDDRTDHSATPLAINAKLSASQRHLKAVIINDDSGRMVPNSAERAAVVTAVLARGLRRGRKVPVPVDKNAPLLLAEGGCEAMLHKVTGDD